MMLVTLSAESLDASRLPACLHAIIWKPPSHTPSQVMRSVTRKTPAPRIATVEARQGRFSCLR